MSQRVYRFATFTVDTGAHVLLKGATRLSIQEQPFQVLLALLEEAGQVVTREALRVRLWGTDTFVDFDQSLNSAVRRLRMALEDNSREPVFVETIPRVGFRFLPAVDLERPAEAPPRPVPTEMTAPEDMRRPLSREMPETTANAVSRRFPSALAGVGTFTFVVGLLLGIATQWGGTRLYEVNAATGSLSSQSASLASALATPRASATPRWSSTASSSG